MGVVTLAVLACVLRATTKKVVNYFWGKSVPPEKIPVTPMGYEKVTVRNVWLLILLLT